MGSVPVQLANLNPDVAPGTGTVTREITVPTGAFDEILMAAGKLTETAPRSAVREQPAVA
jgi:hypothetical protein